ncbi:HTH-type transcriptional activator RhaR [Paenibacillus baekrokdamisoli]|uniref:HTH-type transcriptional activator RhaR n=1 Tax=Paenibacillus baekrokdamisoli TaxID=1712516 RepID=A0A3G9IZL7_9BACL|nr:AraC family transcriptional regulator [Paenibacillus baekrokdamisoli]MBB3072816.1 AraC-like DNA-binding protein [Paenibacillus baekrokdamisoli]BBH24377.1 HTH-type transcriptional activator RhaR [Paenibacillus baekrokdamisoli]
MTNATGYTLKGDFFWKSGFPISVTRERESFGLPMHTHDFIEISYVAEGKGFHYIGDERLLVEKGDVFLIPIGTSHVYRPISTKPVHEMIVYNCLFSPDVVARFQYAHSLPFSIERMLSAESSPYRRFTDSHHEIKYVMEKLFKEHTLHLTGYEGIISGYLLQLILFLNRLDKQEDEAHTSYNQLEPILHFISDHFCEAITLEQLANMIPISVSYLQRLFKIATGQTFTEYIQNLRIQKSCELLGYSGLSVMDISSEVGYKDVKFFHALFKKKTGTSPHQYRKKMTLEAR